MSKSIINEFKIVDIHHHERTRLPRTSRTRGFYLQLDVKKPFIVKTGKFIGQEEGFQVVVFPFDLLDPFMKLILRFICTSLHLGLLIRVGGGNILPQEKTTRIFLTTDYFPQGLRFSLKHGFRLSHMSNFSQSTISLHVLQIEVGSIIDIMFPQ